MSTAAIVLIVLAVIFALGGGGCAVCLCIGAKSVSDQKEQDALDKSRARNVKIDDLLRDYRTNEVRADTQYKGKWIHVVGGQVDEVRRSGDSSYVLIGTGKVFEIPEVQCMLKSDQTGKAASLTKGRHIHVRGKVTGLLLNVLISECEIM
jgi:hypothetical protein